MTDPRESISMPLPLDPEGFLRRECPACERELKWRATADGREAIDPPEGGYFCPYCAAQASADGWWTKAQLEAARAHAYQESFKPYLENRFGGSGFRLDLKEELPAPSLAESNDMRRVDFVCHPEPVKVLEEWDGPVHCPLCGMTTEVSPTRSG